MIKIGDFARLCRVSVVTLRHYDDMGLLKPVRVDGFTGYRYYSVEQMPRLNRILALKDMGFALDQVEIILRGNLTIEQMRAMMKAKQAEVEQQIAVEQERLARIGARLRQIELEDMMPDYDVVLKTIPPMLVASRRVTIPTNDQVPQYLGAAYEEAWNHFKAQGAKDTGPCLAVWYQGSEVLQNEEAEAAFPIDRAIPGTDRVQVYELPQVHVASAVHHGAFEDFTKLHGALLTWIEANGYRIVGPYREVYIKHNPEDMSDSATEVQYPVEKA